jgi:ubiquitin C-terminal hydrolase
MENSAKNYMMQFAKKFTKIKKNQLPQTEDNLIQKIFGGSLVSSVTCQKCKTSSSKIDKFIDISLVSEIINKNRKLCIAIICKVV